MKHFLVIVQLVLVVFVHGQTVHLRNDSTALIGSGDLGTIGVLQKNAELNKLREYQDWSFVSISGWVRTEQLVLPPESSNSNIVVIQQSVRENKSSWQSPSDYVPIDIEFLNTGSQAIKGFVYKISFTDGFGNTVFSELREDQHRIDSNENLKVSWYYSKYDPEHPLQKPYDKIIDAVRSNSIQIKILIITEFFEDGNVTNYTLQSIPKINRK
jgi:hypothetical protein